MMQVSRLFRVPILTFGLLVALCGIARSDDPAESSRESIIQGVRDDVRRHIRMREEAMREAGKRSGRADANPPITTGRAAKKRK